MEDPIDVSFYLGKHAAETIGNLDVPLSNGQIVSINLVEELPDDSNELISFLETENCPRKYWISVATAYSQRNKLNESLNVIKTAMGLSQFNNEDKLSFHTYLSWLYLKFVSSGVDKNENLVKAGEELNQVSNLDSTKGGVSVLLAKAVLYLYKDQIEPALDIFDRLLKIDNNNCFALLGKAQIILNKTKNYANALKLYQQVLILNPLMKPDPRIGIGLCFWFLKDESMALSSWRRALELDPNNLKAKVLLNLANFNINFNNSLGDEDFQLNYEKCLKQLAENYKEKSNDAIILLTLASYYYSKEDYSLVEKISNKVIHSISGASASTKLYNPSKVSKFQSNLLSQAAFWLGRVAFAKSDFMQSQKYFHEAIKLNENNLMAKLGLGQSQINRGSTEEATITYESILKTNPKCLEVNYSLGVLYSKHKSKRKQEQGISMLERYLRLAKNIRGTSTTKNEDDLEFINQEPVALNAFLILSKLYETKDMNQSLTYLNKAIESRKQINQDAPLEVYNNIGVFNFIKHNYEAASNIFQATSEKLKASDDFKDENGDVLMDLRNDLDVTISFNLARSKELSNESESIEIYESLLKDCPNYFSAKLRLLFLDCVSTNKSTKEEIKQEVDNLLNLNASDLEIRSFYGWFVKTFGKKVGLKPDADTNHQKDTLVEYDSHDCYALLSLANIYCIMARDIKGLSQDDKKKKYYIRAVELFTKVLSVDPHNVYGAQGLAIVYIENKESNKGLDILRKIRDSLNDISVYLNLGHVLLDLKQYSKAIENYEIALMRFANNDSKILSFLGRAWLSRGLSEKNLSYLNNALSYSEKALQNSTGAKSSLRFNIAYIQFQIAEFISKLPLEQRLVDEIKEGIDNLNRAIETLNSLSSDDEKHPPYPKSELKARANLGTNTLLNRLNACLDETVASVTKSEIRLKEAKELREQEAAQLLQEEEDRKARERQVEEERAKERAKLQEQAQQWAEEARMNVVVDDEDDDKLFNKESAMEEKKKRSKKSSTKGTKGKKKGKRKNVVSDSEEDAPSPSEDESEPENDSKRKIEENDNEEDEIKTSKKRKVSRLSKETIDDSDDELDDDLFNEDGEEPKENDELPNEDAVNEDQKEESLTDTQNEIPAQDEQ
ncbi:Tetratricopeptide repeat-containing protein [Debaryomyces fabryi]|uniref:Tetratricopeptide repeat-containing protein n=1 Tax=Debaryomyces fabryi TaxID=58627 RepID=A0A0V1Q363_9ASCO|nr:Tetratricopeptide repeat-containing protein [Debaryomyces fabryi]KSA02952.1 Tetratricopeptide repeat-containing protein [Debaryomyces fabryi]CUM50915.1 unnamed protein product [Debaryomyces fabryi]